MDNTIHGKSEADWISDFPLLADFCEARELTWFNPGIRPWAEAAPCLDLGGDDIRDAADRLDRFAPYICQAFPETNQARGIIESDLQAVPRARKALETLTGSSLAGRLMLKRDDALPVSGSIKARGGIYEVLTHAENLALAAGLLRLDDDYRILDSDACRDFFKGHQIMVGSTGNLGLSIGIMGARLGFSVTVHMSADARQWKKDLLREKGVTVKEYESDYGKAVAEGRQASRGMPNCHFIDDENSTSLFLGYSVAGRRLKRQLAEQGVTVDRQHPLFVYLPCGVGGGPGGVAFGLKQAFGDHVHCFFAEPVRSACMFLGMYTGLHDRVSVRDFGMDNRTCADGLAVGRASALVGRLMAPLVDGIYTVTDDNLYQYLALVKDSESIELEPSAVAGLPGIARILAAKREYLEPKGLALYLDSATHLVWATGGNMVPQDVRDQYYETGKSLM